VQIWLLQSKIVLLQLYKKKKMEAAQQGREKAPRDAKILEENIMRYICWKRDSC